MSSHKVEFLGLNASDEEVWADARGVRYVLKGEFRIWEPVRLIPTSSGIRAEIPHERGERFRPQLLARSGTVMSKRSLAGET